MSGWFNLGHTTAPGADAGELQKQDSDFSRLIREMAQDNTVKYGDEIRLLVRSNYLKKPKPAWLADASQDVNAQPQWTEEELKGGYLGVYTKPDGTPRVAVPPVGHQAQGSFVESHFRIEPAHAGLKENAVGRNVSFGDRVVLIDGDGLVWNNKTGGLFGDGYLQPKQRGTPGEAFVAFAKNGKNAFDPVQYGELGIYIDVVDSHRYRAGFNQRLTNFKGNFSNTAGGYVSSDGSGDPLMFVIERYKGKIRNRLGVSDNAHETAAAAEQHEHDDMGTEKTAKESLESQEAIPPPSLPEMTSVSIVTFGETNVQQFQPKFGAPIRLYNIDPDHSQVEIKLSNNRTVVIDGEEIMRAQRHVEEGVLEASWTKAEHAAANQSQQEQGPGRAELLLCFVQLLVAYLGLFFAMLYLTTMEEGGGGHASTRTLKRIRFTSILLCWLLGLVTPRAAYSSQSADAAAVAAAPVYVLAVRAIAAPTAAAPPKRLATKQTAPPASPASPRLAQYGSMAAQENAAAVWNRLDESGTPTHFAFARFLNGERGNRELALKRWAITGEWRKQFGVDLMLQRSHKLFFLIKRHYPTFLYGRTKYGHPIYIEQVGKINTKKIRDAGGKLKDMMYHYVYTSEFMWTVLEPAEYGSSLTILDVQGIGLFDFAGENLEFIKKATAVVQEHYPERGFMVFIINAPRWFTGIWAVVSAWVNPVTIKKIRICGTNYQEELFKFVDRDALPVCYGGTNQTPLEDSEEERLFRNVAARALIAHNDIAVGPEGNAIPVNELKLMVDESVDHLAYKSQMQRVSSVDGSLLCDEKGRPLERF